MLRRRCIVKGMVKPLVLRRLFLAINALLILALIFLWSQKTSLPVYAEVPEFSLVDQSGNAFNKKSMQGSVWVADFIFTRCAGICPMMSTHTKKLQNELKVNFVSFSTDPEYDLPQILTEYANQYGANPGRWYFLTGSKETLNLITSAFKMSPINEPMMHSASFVLIDRDGKVRGFYDSDDPGRLLALKKDARHL